MIVVADTSPLNYLVLLGGSRVGFGSSGISSSGETPLMDRLDRGSRMQFCWQNHRSPLYKQPTFMPPRTL
jgi:hypothetical protein